MPIRLPNRKRPKRRNRPTGPANGSWRVAVVATLAEAREALAQADRRMILVTPPHGASTLGVGYIRALMDLAAAEFPAVAIEPVIDCGADPGYALAALRLRFKCIVLAGHPRAREGVAEIAHQLGAKILRHAPRPSRRRKRR